GVCVPVARGGVNASPRRVGIVVEKNAARRMEVYVELKSEHRIARHELRPMRFRVRCVDVLLAQDMERFEPQSLADVWLRRQLVRRAEFVGQLQRAKVWLDLLQMMQHSERVALCIIEYDAPLHWRERDNVPAGRAGLRGIERIGDMPGPCI